MGKYEFAYAGMAMSGEWGSELRDWAMIPMVGSDGDMEWDSEYTHWFIYWQSVSGQWEAGVLPVAKDGCSEHDIPSVHGYSSSTADTIELFDQYMRDAVSGTLLSI